MINKATGEVRFSDWEIPLSALTTRSEFLDSTLAQKAKTEITNEPYTSWRIRSSQWNNQWWTILVRFNEEKLTSIILAVWDDETGPKWENWSEKVERKLAEHHSTALVQMLGASPHKFPWGVVESLYDEKSTESYIRIEYF